jgi:hypothetical protein
VRNPRMRPRSLILQFVTATTRPEAPNSYGIVLSYRR